MNRSWIAACALLAATGTASAQGYIGADLGRSTVTDFGSYVSYNLYGGYAFNENVAVELGYRTLGDDTETISGLRIRLKGSAFQLSSVLSGALSQDYSAFLRLGYNEVRAKASVSGLSASDSEGRFLWGLGVEGKFTPQLSGRLEYQKPDSDVYVISWGVKYVF